jgi:hypothetical protein
VDPGQRHGQDLHVRQEQAPAHGGPERREGSASRRAMRADRSARRVRHAEAGSPDPARGVSDRLHLPQLLPGDLAQSGEADSLQSKDGEVLYRACSTAHHHHLICRDCGLTLELEAKNLEKWADEVAADNGFSEPSHTIDIFGICSDCRSQRNNLGLLNSA